VLLDIVAFEHRGREAMNGNLRALLVGRSLVGRDRLGASCTSCRRHLIEPKPVVPAPLPEYQVEGGVASLNETVDRTLFNSTRRPAPPATASVEGEKKVKAASSSDRDDAGGGPQYRVSSRRRTVQRGMCWWPMPDRASWATNPRASA
jgi:hypothetical protein